MPALFPNEIGKPNDDAYEDLSDLTFRCFCADRRMRSEDGRHASALLEHPERHVVGPGNNYDNFVAGSEYDPDSSRLVRGPIELYKAGFRRKWTCGSLPDDNWGELAARYGPKYWYKGGHRDNFPQVITSKYPIENVERIVGSQPDSVVSHGAAGRASRRTAGRSIS